MEQVKSVITLRSGTVIDRPIPEPCENKDNENSKGKEELNKFAPSEEITIILYEPPFPNALNKLRKSNHSSAIYKIFKQVKVKHSSVRCSQAGTFICQIFKGLMHC